jgi:hypothetical protein
MSACSASRWSKTASCWRDHRAYSAQGVVFVRPPEEQSHGIVAVFRDLYGNLWDLLEPRPPNSSKA